MPAGSHGLKPKPLKNVLVLACVSFVVQVIVAAPILVRILTSSFRYGPSSWDRADSIYVPICLFLQSVVGAFLLWRSRRSARFVWHAGKGIAYALLSFLITAPLVYFVLGSFYNPIRTMTPFMFFVMIFFLGHRVPLLGVSLAGFLTVAADWEMTDSKT
jgi:hypothetical protein